MESPLARNIVAALETTSVKRIIWITGMGSHHEIKGPRGFMLSMLAKKMPEYIEAADLIAASKAVTTLLRCLGIKDGNTDAIAAQFAKGAEEAGHEVKKEYLFTKKMNGCLGCQHCRNTDGTCVWKDDLVSVNEEILASDVIVFVSPVYFYGVTAQLKMAMDRTYNIEERVHDKKIFFITSAAAPFESEFKNNLTYAINTVQGWVDCYRDNVCLEKVFVAWNMWGEPDITKHDAYHEAYEAGKNL